AHAARRGVRPPREQVLGVEPAVVDAVFAAAPDTDDAPAGDGDVEGVTVGVQDRGRRHPPFDVLAAYAVLERGVDAHGPARAAAVRSATSPRFGDAVSAAHVPPPVRLPVTARCLLPRAHRAYPGAGPGNHEPLCPGKEPAARAPPPPPLPPPRLRLQARLTRPPPSTP